MSRSPGNYYPNIVREFFSNYLALVEKDCPLGTKILDLPNRESVLVRKVTIDISIRMLNRILFGHDYQAPTAVPELEHCLNTASIQRSWLSSLITNNSNPSWALNPKKHTVKSSLNFCVKFW